MRETGGVGWIDSVRSRAEGELDGPDRPHRAADARPGVQGEDRSHPEGREGRLGHAGSGAPAPGGAQRPARADRRRGLRQPGDLRRSGRDPEPDAGRRRGPALQPLPRHRGLLAHPGGNADGPQPPLGRVRLARRAPRPVPRILGPAAQDLRPRREDAADERLLHLGLRQVAPDARPRAGPGGPVRPLAERLGLRLLLGLPGRRGGPVRSRDHGEQHHDRRARGQGLLLPGRDGRQGDRVAARGAGAGRAEAVLHVLLDRGLSCASSRPQALGRQVRGPVRRGLGPLPRGDVRAPEEARRRPGGRGAHGPERRDAGLGLADGRAEEALRPADGGLRGLPGERGPQRRPAARRVGGDGRARRHARDLHLGRQRRQHGGHADGRIQRALRPQRDHAHRGGAARADRALRRPRRMGRAADRAALFRLLGLGRQRPVPVGQADVLLPRRGSRPDGGLVAAADQGQGRVARAVHPLHRHRPDDPRGRGDPGSPCA